MYVILLQLRLMFFFALHICIKLYIIQGATTDTKNCKACSKAVFQMEQIKAEKAVWHKNCFRCTECNKQLT